MVRYQPLGFCQSAPTDGRGEFTNSTGKGFYTSKQNSDASGMFYQWGLKSPFTFATSSEQWGDNFQRGKCPVKIYTIDGVLIHQEEKGSSNKDKQPAGGVIVLTTNATSMMETVKNPIILYRGNSVINQVGYTKDLWDYYWTSYSRGTDGIGYPQKPSWHNVYLDGYTYHKLKSIFDPCPFGYKVPSNGTWNQFNIQLAWTPWSYIGGASWKLNTIYSWLPGLGRRNIETLYYTGVAGYYSSGTITSQASAYGLDFNNGRGIYKNPSWGVSLGNSVRCIEGLCASVRSDRRTRC